jgi:hypothetical protein
MASSPVTDQITRITQSGLTGDTRLQFYKSDLFPLLCPTLAPFSLWKNNIEIVLNHVFAESTGLLLARPLLQELIQLIAITAHRDWATAKEDLLKLVIEALTPRVVSFEEQVRDNPP